MITGIDISHWQSTIDWAQVNANPDIGFVIMKATEGNTFVDGNFARNWNGCKKPKAAYHFWRYAVDGLKQAQFYFDEVMRVIGDAKMRPVFDYEDTYAPKETNAPSALKEFHEAAQVKWLGRIPLVYTGAWWWDAWIKRDVCGSNPLWHAQYPKWWRDASGNPRVATSFAEILGYLSVHPTAKPTLPATGGWPSWKIWQFTSSGRIDGISGNVDLNLYNGDAQDLGAFFYTDSIMPPPPPPTDPLEPRVVALEALASEQGARILAVEAKLAVVKEAL